MAKIGNITHQRSQKCGEGVYYHGVPVNHFVIAATKLDEVPLLIDRIQFKFPSGKIRIAT